MFTSDETKFIEFLKFYNEFYWPSHKIAESSNGVTILPIDDGIKKKVITFLFS